MSIAFVSDSRFAYARFADDKWVKPGFEKKTPTYFDVRPVLGKLRNQISQFSFSGLKAFNTHGSGRKDREAFFSQLKTAFPGMKFSIKYLTLENFRNK